MSKPVSPLAHRILAAAVFGAVLSCSWDIWWHMALGRESLWELPHLMLYTFLNIALCISIYGWITTRSRLWARVLLTLIAMMISAGADQAWHEIFGSEDLRSPLIVVSPPHIALVACLILLAIFTLPLLHHDRNEKAQEFFGSLIFASLFTLGLFYSIPFHPTLGFALAGFAGAGVVAGLFTLILLGASDWQKTFAGSTLAVIVFLLLYGIPFGAPADGPRVLINPHGTPPFWLFAFACLAPAVLADLWKGPLWLRGAACGGLFSLILFGFSSRYFDPVFQYGTGQAMIAVVCSVIGGLLAGVVASFWARRAHQLTTH